MGQKNTIWKAEPHTIAKIDILEAYLVAYFIILGPRRNNLLYIDGFAGPDKYTNRSSGSPTAALKAITTAIHNVGSKWHAGKIRVVFVEEDKRRYEVLCAGLPPNSTGSPVEIDTYNMEFTKALPLIKRSAPEPFVTETPLFVFIDPFGATGAPFNHVADILNSSCSEVLINLDADGVSRIFAAKQDANHEAILTDIFGDRSWETELRDDQSLDLQCRKVLHLYKQRLRTLPGVRYIFEVEMQGANSILNYYLVFASKHPLGLMKMKAEMRRIAQNGTYKFADAHVAQTALFRFDQPQAYHMDLYNTFKGRVVSYDCLKDDVTAYALNNTPFCDAKSMLRELEKDDIISVISVDPKRKRGTFNETVTAIDFHGKVQYGSLF